MQLHKSVIAVQLACPNPQMLWHHPSFCNIDLFMRIHSPAFQRVLKAYRQQISQQAKQRKVSK